MKPSVLTVDLAARLRGKGVLIVGDVMLDQYLFGDAERISPEAPVPVIRLDQERCYLGGAGNVARNVTALGGKASLVGVAGDDDAGRMLQDLLRQESLDAHVPLCPGRVTTRKTRVLARNQQMLRLDRECPCPLNEGEVRLLLDRLAPLAEAHEVLILSDYGKGLVGPSFMESLRALLASLPRSPLLLVDPRPQNMHLYQGAFLLTPNLKESADAVRLSIRSQEEIIAAGRAVMAGSRTHHLLMTLGPQGMASFLATGEVWRIPTAAHAVFDVSGAGDTVIGALALGLAAGMPLLPACMLANFAAGIVVAKVGTATATPDELVDAVITWPVPDLEKWT
ncbi:MAG: PfkB family carbohydrate kinase [Deltaproteobacteria bacterium]|jgi:rfaE bifunctional protein kinase chain/domain|nr:PfkB family carbohydrate kinase [Deltaproteobacteria bacterium]